MKLVLLRGCTRAGKSTVLRLLAQSAGIATLEMDAYKRAKYGSAAACNPHIDFPAIGKEAKRLLRGHRAVVVEESFVDKPHVAAVARWAGFDLDSPALLLVWLDLTLAEALQRKLDSPFPRAALEAEFARYAGRYLPAGERRFDMAATSAEAARDGILDWVGGAPA